MHFLDQFGLDLVFTREYLKAGVFVSLLSVWVLVALFYYLNLYTKRRYFTIWTAAWLFYALWITLSFGVSGDRHQPLLLMLQQWCVGISAIFLLWGSLNFLGSELRPPVFWLFIVFLLVWSFIGAYQLGRPLELEVPIFSLIALASGITSVSFFKYRRQHPYVGATLLTLGFFLWGIYMAGYPFLENSENLTSAALFISAGLQLMLAVSMIVLVLEEARETQHQVEEQAETRTAERDALQTRVISTEQRYQKLFDLASEAIVIADAGDFKILEMNRAAERALGISQADMGKHSLTSFCQLNTKDGVAPKTSEEWFQLACRQRPINLIGKNGSVKPVEITGTQIDLDGRPAYQFFLVELTERARLEQQLRQAEKLSAIGQMISGVAHELNNPLAVVKGYLELVLSHHDLAPNTRADLEKAAHESNRAAKLVMNFLSFAREQPSHRELVNLNELAARVVELRRVDVVVAKTDMLLELEPNLPPVWADPDQIQQMVVNLMNNSLQAMVDLPRRGQLRLRTWHIDDLVRLAIEDNGPGVPPHLLERIFEPFFTTKEVGAGTGLGLSIAHSLMAEHKGRIFYEKSAMGGAGFVLEFPASSPDEVPQQKKDQSPTAFITKPVSAEPARAGKILVLDDEKAIAEMLGEMLGLLGYTPTLCNLAAHALEILDTQEFDLIISDFRMPNINGRQFYTMAIEKKPALASRIVFLTGDVVNEETRDFLNSIGTPHIAKPFNLTSVKKVVAKVIEANAAAGAKA